MKSNKKDLYNIDYHILNSLSLEEIKVAFNKLIQHQYFSKNKILKVILVHSNLMLKEKDNSDVINPKKLKLQGELITHLINEGAFLDSIDIINIEIDVNILHMQKELFLNQFKGLIYIDNFLWLTLKAGTTTYDSITNQYIVNPEKLTLQGKLIAEALNKGANINKIPDNLNIRIESLQMHKDLLFNNQVNYADKFLKLITLGNIDNANKDEKKNQKLSIIQYELIKEAIAFGADVNTQIKRAKDSTLSLLDLGLNKDINTLLKAYGAKCSVETERFASFIKYENYYYYFSYSHIYANKIYNNLNAPKAETNKIPYLLHHVWLTNSQSPKEINPLDIANIVETKQTFEKSNKKWMHIVWTNDKSLIPNSVIELEKFGIEVRSIQSIKSELRLFDQIEKLIGKKLWGMASDVLRYSVIEYLGGVYADLDFEFKRLIEDDLYKYDYFALTVNCFFAAKPKHPIICSLLDKVKENLVAPPPYIANINESDPFTMTIYYTLEPFSLAYLKASNLGSNTDIMYPPMNSLDSNYKHQSTECSYERDALSYLDFFNVCISEDFLIGQDGAHGHQFTWLED